MLKLFQNFKLKYMEHVQCQEVHCYFEKFRKFVSSSAFQNNAKEFEKQKKQILKKKRETLPLSPLGQQPNSPLPSSLSAAQVAQLSPPHPQGVFCKNPPSSSTSRWRKLLHGVASLLAGAKILVAAPGGL
jgi:hypothetical protein